MAVLQADMSVSCHIFHPSMRNSQKHKPTDVESYFKAYFYLGASFVLALGSGSCFAVFFFAVTFTSCIDPSVQICHDTQVVSDLTFE